MDSSGKAKCLFIATILLLGSFIGVLHVTPTVAAAATITTSATTFWGNAALMVTITDPNKINGVTDNATALVEYTSGGASASYTAEFQEYFDTGIFKFLVGNTTAIDPASPPYANASVTKKLPSPGIDKDKDVKFTYYSLAGPISATVTYKPVKGSLTNDRDVIPPAAILRPAITDQDWNLDPTAKDNGTSKTWFNFSISLQIPAIILARTVNFNFTETDINTAVLKSSVDLATVLSATEIDSLTNGMLVILKYKDNETDDDVTKQLTIGKANGLVSTEAASIPLSDDSFKITVTDADRNLNTDGKDKLGDWDLQLNITHPNGTVYTTWLNATETETDSNTNLFEFELMVNITSGVFGIAGNQTKKITVVIPPADVKAGDLKFKATYTDAYYVTAPGTAQATFTLAKVAPTLSFDKNSYTPDQAKYAVLTLYAPMLNDDPDSVDLLTISNVTAGATNYLPAINYTSAGVNAVVGNLSLKVDDTFSNLAAAGYVGKQLVETNVSTGLFSITLDLIAAGAKLDKNVTVYYYDIMKDANVSVTVPISAIKSTVALDRASYPVAVDETAKVFITVADPKANINTAGIEEVNVNVTVFNATGQQVSLYTGVDVRFNRSAVLTESGVNTATFKGDISYKITEKWVSVTVGGTTYYLANTDSTGLVNLGNVTGKAMVNGKILIAYGDPLGEVKAEGRVRAHTATLVPSATSIGLSQTLTLTMTEPDMDLDSTGKQTVKVDFTRKRDTTETVIKTGIGLDETGDSTGVFTKSLVVGKEDLADLKSGDTLIIKYTDKATAESYYGTKLVSLDLKPEVKVISRTATLTLDHDVYGPFSKVKITLADLDLYYKDKADVTLSAVKTSNDTLENWVAVEGEKGVYNFTVKLGPAGFGGGQLTSKAVDDLYVYYADEFNDAGKAQVVSAHATIRSSTGEVILDKTTYNVKDWLNITVNDSEQNKDPDIVNFVDIWVYTESWPLGQKITTPETDLDTGIFQALVQIVDTVPSGSQVMGKLTDTITVNYTDVFDSAGKEVTVTATARIILDLAPPTIVHTPVTFAVAGAPMTITATVMDDVGVGSVTLFYRVVNTTAYSSVAMTGVGSTYTGEIPAGSVTIDGVQYYIKALDTSNNAKTTDVYTVTVSVYSAKTSGAGTIDPATGVAKTTFAPGQSVAVTVNITNGLAADNTVVVGIRVTDPDGGVLYPITYYKTTIGPTGTITPEIEYLLPADAATGTWTVSFFVYTDWVRAGGVLSAEPITVTFEVASS